MSSRALVFSRLQRELSRPMPPLLLSADMRGFVRHVADALAASSRAFADRCEALIAAPELC